MSLPVTRIISDLHYHDPGTALARIDALAPLLVGVDHLIVNGDALDTQVLPQAREVAAEMRDFFSARVRQVTFINGNHDPDISEVNELFLADGAIWVTHGDVFFDHVAPWGRLAKELRRRIEAQPEFRQPTEMRKLDVRFRVFRRVCLKLPREHDPLQRGPWAMLKRIAKAIFPPTRVLTMLRVWSALPRIVDSFAREQRPETQVVITGHTHHPGAWTAPSGRIVINTGCFCPPRGGAIVDVIGDRVIVRRLRKDAGSYRLGETLREFSAANRRVSALSAQS